MSKITDFISSIGENPKFIAFAAHSGVAATVLLLFSGWHQYLAAVIAIGLAGFKEFAFDRLYEKSPPQTFWDDLEDFTGYLTGIAFALFAAHINL